MSFEQDIERMEEITKKLKNNETPLSEAIALFEEGVAIARNTEKQLSEIERKVEILLTPTEEEHVQEPTLAPFSEEMDF
ncbi:MAG: exodeoxyribonuclease VII small subunit [Sphaerochaetaceae bacterium]|jgi:exodeoxyribonuclease VII small subunit|nr:exodeoxyribonuclease VII small subunit [Sphaerochaetaceae bacterium]MDY0371579.1 exodeoxyribonuclease VII small subunit [Sphaerochaetaceae bacterium]